MFTETLWAVFTVSVAGGILLRLMPQNGKLLPYIQFLLALVLLLMLLSPLQQLLGGLSDDGLTAILAPFCTEVSDRFYEDAVEADAVRRASLSVVALLSAETGIPESDMEVSLTTQASRSDHETEITVTAATVTLFVRAHRIAADKIRAAVERILLCPCNVVVEVRGDA